MREMKGIAYAAHPECLLDLYLPTAEHFPVFVYFHGGGIEKGSRAGVGCFVEELTKAGIAVVSADYRMYPTAKYPEFIEDSAAAVAWVKHRIGEYGVCDGIFVGGSSAGGYLSMMLCFDEGYYKAAGISPDDIAGYVHDAGQPTAHFNVLKYRGIDPRRVIVDESAPLFHIGKSGHYPPMHFIVSDNDMKNRYEQTMLVLSTLKHFELDAGISHTVMHGKHCAYCSAKNNVRNEKGEYAFGAIIRDFILSQ